MERTKFMRLTRAIEREAAARGFKGDIFAEAENVPLVGTLREQMQIAAIGCDCSPGPMSTRDSQLLNRLVRAAVLTGPPREPKLNLDHDARLARAWRRK